MKRKIKFIISFICVVIIAIMLLQDESKAAETIEKNTEQISKGKVNIITEEKEINGGKVTILKDVEFAFSGTKGDVNGDGIVSIEDAIYMLTKTTAILLNDNIKLTEDELKYADINNDGVLDIRDAQGILVYYAKKAAGLNPTWEAVINEQNNVDENLQASQDFNTEYVDGYLNKITFADENDSYYSVKYTTVNNNEKVLSYYSKFKNNLEVERYEYDVNGNFLRKSIREFYEDGNPKTLTQYDKDGKKMNYWESKDADNSKKTTFNESRIKYEGYKDGKLIVYTKENYDQNNEISSTEFYDADTNKILETVKYNDNKVIVNKYADVKYNYDSKFVWQLYPYTEVEENIYETAESNIIKSSKTQYWTDKVLQCYKVTNSSDQQNQENTKYYNEKNEEITLEQFNDRLENPIKPENNKNDNATTVDTSNKIKMIFINGLGFNLEKTAHRSYDNNNTILR